MTLEPTASVEELLGQSVWITRLSRVLVADPATADDIAQQTWADVLAAPPRSGVDLRAWLATILRRKASRQRRSDQRRDRRERSVARAEALPSAADLTSRVEMHRTLTDAVLALEEPYRETIVLRFFENLDVAEIAERTKAPRNTVRSRLQRGLQHLRARLDVDHGGRERWLPAVAALGAREVASGSAMAGLTGGLVLSIAMKTILSLTAALAAGLVAIYFATRTSGSVDPSAPPLAGSAGPQHAEVVAAGSAPTESRLERAAVTAPGAEPAASLPVPRLVVGRDGAPLAGVRLRAQSPFAVRWQGGDVGWISGRDKSMRILPAEEQILREDPVRAASFFSQFGHPEEWRATILGTPIPERETATQADGSFAFAPGLGETDATIAVVDPGFVLVSAGQTGVKPWVVGPATRVVGRVLDQERKPIPHAQVKVLVLTARGASDLEGLYPVTGGEDGSFLLRRVLAGGVLSVSKNGYASAFLPLEEAAAQTVEVVMLPRGPSDRTWIEGSVVDGAGRSVAGASIWFGRERTRSGTDGRFRISIDAPQPEHALTVLAPGKSLWHRDGFGAELLRDRNVGRDLLVVLSATPSKLRGVVLGSNGVPLGGALVGIVDATLLDLTFEGVEARVGGWSGGVKTAADGTFELPGLAERSYRLRAVDPETGLVGTSAPVRAPNDNVILRLPSDARRDVKGRVMVDGKPLAGAMVEIGFCTHVTKGGGTMFDSAPPVACDADGRFVLRVLPPRTAWLVVRQGGGVLCSLPVESLTPVGDELVVACSEKRWLQLVAGEQAVERTISFEMADGSVIPTTPKAVVARDGSAPVLPIPAGAVGVVLDHGMPSASRLDLTDDRAVHLRVR